MYYGQRVYTISVYAPFFCISCREIWTADWRSFAGDLHIPRPVYCPHCKSTNTHVDCDKDGKYEIDVHPSKKEQIKKGIER